MTDPAPHDLRPPIDARSLVARGAMRGAIYGFCWSLLVAVPLAVVFWFAPSVGPLGALIALGGICSIWSEVAAFAAKRRTRERTFTDEQRAVLRRHLRRTRIQAACVSVLLIALTERFEGGDSSLIKPGHLCALVILSIAISSDLVGRAKGNAAVRAMQQETWAAVCRIHAEPLAVTNEAMPSNRVSPSTERLAESLPRQGEPLAERGLED